ncbi:MAG: hypothetical protein LBQ26_00495 [Holosporales bacterium]|jgi:mevalonate kinase|nr:hypothetical protein [Holosporales bacterium]
MLRNSSVIKSYKAPAVVSKLYSLPGKALLFGEYGLLLGSPGVVVTLPAFRMQVSCVVQDASSTPVIQIYSAFLKTGRATLRSDALEENGFFQGILAPYKAMLEQFYANGKDFVITIEKGFPPHLGVGSSSALLASLHAFLFDYLSQGQEAPLTSPVFFHHLHDSLKRIQGTGSGYDATVQLAASQMSHPQLWRYQQPPITPVPDFAPITGSSGHYGTLLATQVYANTKVALAQFSKEKHAKYAQAHAALAEAFLKDPCPDRCPTLIAKAQHIQKQQGHLPNIDLINNLERARVPFKSLGAGFGDCVWSPWTARQLQDFRPYIVTEILVP